MNLDALWQGLEASPIGDFVATNEWAFPAIESIHVIAIVIVVGSIAVMDLRLVGLASRSTAVTRMSRDTLPWTWGAFVIAAITGALLFVSRATSYVVNPWFLGKLVLLVLAGVNMGVFHIVTWRSVGIWDANSPLPSGAKLAGIVSLLLWVLVIFFGRAIGFTLDAPQ
jgi:hypothetical protein